MTEEQFKSCCSETAKYRHLTEKYCYVSPGVPGCGVDIASQGDSVVPWAIGYDLPIDEFNHYCDNRPAHGPIQLRGHADHLPFDQESLNFVYCSHLLEDFENWEPVFSEWLRVLRPNGYLIILIPDKTLWKAALDSGQSPNCSHKHEGEVGELSKLAVKYGLEIVEDRLTNLFPGDYTILGVFRKIHGGWLPR